MGVFKEEVKALEEVKGQQRQIWPDSCDYGVILEAPNDSREQSVRGALAGLKGLPTLVTEWGNEYSGGTTYVVFIAWEKEGNRLNGTKFRVTFGHSHNHGFSCLPKHFRYISIDSGPESFTEEELAAW